MPGEKASSKATSRRVQTPLTLALEKHRERFSPYKVSHVDETGRVIKFADIKTKGIPFDITKFSMPYNPNRMSHVSVYEAIKDPHQTILNTNPRPHYAPFVSLDTPRKSTVRKDKEAKEI